MKANLMRKHSELVKERKYAVAWRVLQLLQRGEITLFKNIEENFSCTADRETDLILRAIGYKPLEKKYLTQYHINNPA